MSILKLKMNTRTKPKKILFLDILTDDPAERKKDKKAIYHGGTYAEDVRKLSGIAKSAFAAVDATKGILPPPSNYRAIIIGGSMHNPVEGQEKPWMKKTYRFIARTVHEGVPLLGICGGLQFTVRALGGTIVRNPRGREMGSIKISLTRAGARDPLFKTVPKNFVAQSSHCYMAKGLEPGWKLLASSRMCRIQGIAIGRKIKLLQFHPEMAAEQLKTLAHMRKNTLLKEEFIKNERDFARFAASIKDTRRTGRKIIRNFLDLTR